MAQKSAADAVPTVLCPGCNKPMRLTLLEPASGRLGDRRRSAATNAGPKPSANLRRGKGR